MKTNLKLLTYLALIFTVSCINPTDMITVIRDDASCYKEFNSKTNRAFLLGDTTNNNNPFPVDIDSTCHISWKFRDSEWIATYPAPKSVLDSMVNVIKKRDKSNKDTRYKSDDFSVRIRKNYASVDEMKAKFRLKQSHSWSNMKINYELEKNFRWFYTYYNYRETYKKIQTFTDVPIEKYMSRDEVLFWFTGKPDLLKGMNGIEIREFSGNLEDKYNKWYTHNCWNSTFQILLENYDSIKNKPLTKEDLAELKDTIFNSVGKNETETDMERTLDKYFHTNVFTRFWNEKNSPMKIAEKNLENQDFVGYFKEQFNYKLLLPGKITRSGDAIIHGDTLIWRLTSFRMIPDDYRIEAQSRVVNIWAFVLSAFIILFAVASLFWKVKK